MGQELWTRLAATFPVGDIAWRIVALAADPNRVQVRPQLAYRAVVRRLDEVLGVAGWSNVLRSLGAGVACELTIGGVTKTALVMPPADPRLPWTALGEDALVRAAELFGICPPMALEEAYWSDWDPEAGRLLHEPAAIASRPDGHPEPGAIRTEGQQAIDRLVERLRDEGLGLEAAKLLNAFGGYGTNPEAARELYARLRGLLVESGGRSPVRPGAEATEDEATEDEATEGEATEDEATEDEATEDGATEEVRS